MAQQRRGGFKRRKKVDYIAANKIKAEKNTLCRGHYF